MGAFGQKDTQVVVEAVGREVALAHLCLGAMKHLSAREASALPASVPGTSLAWGAVFGSFEELGIILRCRRRGVSEVQGDAILAGKLAGEVFVDGFGSEGWLPVRGERFSFSVGRVCKGAVGSLNREADSFAFEGVPKAEKAGELGVAAPVWLGR